MASASWRPGSWSTKAMRSYCTGETKVEVAKRSRRQPALEGLSGDLATIAGARTLADEVNKLGRFDAVIHNAGVGYRERRVEMEPGVPSVFAVNMLAPYILTALVSVCIRRGTEGSNPTSSATESVSPVPSMPTAAKTRLLPGV